MNNNYDIESQNTQRTSGKRGIRYIPEVTADNLPSRIRLEFRRVGKEEKSGNLLSAPSSQGQAVGNKIVSG